MRTVVALAYLIIIHMHIETLLGTIEPRPTLSYMLVLSNKVGVVLHVGSTSTWCIIVVVQASTACLKQFISEGQSLKL